MTAAERNSRLEADGFVVLDLLSPEQVSYLHGLCDKYLGGNRSDFVSSSHILEQQDSDFINAELHRILADPMSSLFPGLQLLGGTLATKVPGHSVLVAHQDWSIVDESRFRSYNLWIPLVDTGPENGTLGLVPGSHRWPAGERGLNIPNPYEVHTSRLLKIGYEPPLKAGQGILYNHRLVHYSRPNQQAERRHTVIIGLRDQQAGLRVSFTLDGKEVRTYAVEEPAFYRFEPGAVADSCPLLGSTPLDARPLSWKELEKLYHMHIPAPYLRHVPSFSWLERLLNKITGGLFH